MFNNDKSAENLPVKALDEAVKSLLSSLATQTDLITTTATNHARTTLLFVQFVRDVLDDLKFAPADMEKMQFDLDDNFDVLEAKYNLLEESDLKSIVDQLMTQMLKLQMEISDKLIDLKSVQKQNAISDVDKIRATMKKILADPKLFRQTLIESGVYDDQMKLRPEYKYYGTELEKHQEAVTIVDELRGTYHIGDYRISNIESDLKTTLILLNTNMGNEVHLDVDIKELLSKSKFFDNFKVEDS